MPVNGDAIRTRLFYRHGASLPGSPWRSCTWDWVPVGVAGVFDPHDFTFAELQPALYPLVPATAIVPTYDNQQPVSSYLAGLVNVMRASQTDFGWMDIEFGFRYTQILQSRWQHIMDLQQAGAGGVGSPTPPQVALIIDKRSINGVPTGTAPNVKVRYQIGRDYIAQPNTTTVSATAGGVQPTPDMNTWIIGYNTDNVLPQPPGVGPAGTAPRARLRQVVTVKNSLAPNGDYRFVHRMFVDPLVGTQRRRVKRSNGLFANPVL